MKTFEEIRTGDVTSEQIGKCHAVIGPDGKKFWMVESEQDSLKEYKVQWNAVTGFSCSCKAGLEGFAHCGPASQGVCKHCRWACGAERELRSAMTELQAAITAQAAKPVEQVVTNVDLETRARVAAACERQASAPVGKAKGTSKAFSILR